MVSEAFRVALLRKRAQGVRAYKLALDNGISPSLFSAMLTGARRVRDGDERIVRIGAQLGLSADECFEQADTSHAKAS